MKSRKVKSLRDNLASPEAERKRHYQQADFPRSSQKRKAKFQRKSSGPGSQYEKASVREYEGTKVAGIVVWNGVQGYENEPPVPGLVIAEKLKAEKLLVIHVGEDDGELRFQLGISAALDGADVIFCAINDRVYRQLCRSVQAMCTSRLQ